MTSNSKLLYNSVEVWDQTLQQGQKNLAQAIIDFFPTSAITVLDVGCGDGKLTQLIKDATGCKMVGLDFSQEALSRCQFKTVYGDATDLPFQDNEFDLVLSTDMLEHLPTETEKIVWEQLFRVAKKWVMVAVPFEEELLDATTKCPHCDKQYHVNWHERSYDYHTLATRTPEGFEVDKVVLSGEAWPLYHTIETQFRRFMLNEWSGWRDSFCPQCNQPGNDPDAAKPLPSLIGAALGSMIYSSLSNKQPHRLHSEILVLYRRKNLNIESQNKVPMAQVIPWDTNRISLQDLPIEKNLIPTPQASRAVFSSDGEIILQFPAYASYNSLKIEIEDKENNKLSKFTLTIEDGLGTLYKRKLHIRDGKPVTLTLPRETISSYYGILVRLPTYVPLKSIQLGSGLPIYLVKPSTQGIVSYQKINHDSYLTYLQVTKPCTSRIDTLCQSSSPQFNPNQLFEHIQQLHQTQRLSFIAHYHFEIRVIKRIHYLWQFIRGIFKG